MATTETIEATTQDHEPTVVQPYTEGMQPDLTAQDIMVGEEIVPNDIDTADVMDFADVGTIYGSDGQENVGAHIVNEFGNEMLVVNVLNDDMFDAVMESNGFVMDELTDNLL